jgi:hypothetical protein
MDDYGPEIAIVEQEDLAGTWGIVNLSIGYTQFEWPGSPKLLKLKKGDQEKYATRTKCHGNE